MVSAADGAEEYYNHGNEARYESVDQAKTVEANLKNAYKGHHEHHLITNEGKCFDKKLDSTINTALSIVNKRLNDETNNILYEVEHKSTHSNNFI